MVYILANTGVKNQRLYAFETVSPIECTEYKLVQLEHVQYDQDGNILVDSDTLREFECLGVPVFETKISAKKYMNGLSLVGKAKYVGLRFKRAFELDSIDLASGSTWTFLNR
ncbi:hypothetical protein [Vibrio splendidus]|uniref:hypothetical protein n=1 Tax=Vibrio splendidus TaxID=29497 RepID=UPI002468A487|nr:hypothetical protein [Vibrio splendidus]MDH5895773.1 hypothetical protein [Vibrio splendidus]